MLKYIYLHVAHDLHLIFSSYCISARFLDDSLINGIAFPILDLPFCAGHLDNRLRPARPKLSQLQCDVTPLLVELVPPLGSIFVAAGIGRPAAPFFTDCAAQQPASGESTPAGCSHNVGEDAGEDEEGAAYDGYVHFEGAYMDDERDLYCGRGYSQPENLGYSKP